MTDPTSVYSVYNYTGKTIQFVVSDSSKYYGTKSLGQIAPSLDKPTSFTVAGTYDTFSFANSSNYGQYSANYLANQSGGIDSGFDYNNLTFVVGTEPEKLVDSSGKTVQFESSSIVYTVYLGSYSKTFINTITDGIKSQIDMTTTTATRHFRVIILFIILAAIAIAVAYYVYHKRASL